ncbi:DUF3560 domain-containing protein [Nocardia terpenica]|uniref:DUF3560 domain-containing protein n=1 Tax=Nocardia terpenica TaxID=455432 RepID=A0A291RYX3_9NOCA|nr:DUF3560 domain-containing protein [Nocardia terpenica]ATL72499.1 hypothetical protein CRH09_39695 [Nocardia terpenica]
MAELTITHTAAEGTQLEGDCRGDGTYEIMCTVERRIGRRYWKWSNSLGGWIVRNSRDRQPNNLAITGAAEALREAGHSVSVRIDRRHRAADEVAADRAAQRRARADALRDKAERHHRQAAAAEAAADRAHQSLPPGGEPIKIGHHSQRRHERLHECADRTGVQAREARAKAAATEQRAQTAEFTATAPECPGVIQRRIARLEAEQRADERARDGYTRNLGINGQTGHPITQATPPATGEYRARLEAAIAQRADEIAYERAQLDAARAAGAVVFTAAMIRRGDYVHTGQSSRPRPEAVLRVNKTTVTLDVEPGWNNKLPINKITGLTNSAGQRVDFDASGTRSDEQ